MHHLQIIGEAARAIPDDIRKSAPAIPWRDIVGMRHILVHDYFGINVDVVWGVVTRDLRPLKQNTAALLGGLK